MRTILIVVLFVLFALPCWGQSAKVKPQRKSASRYSDAYYQRLMRQDATKHRQKMQQLDEEMRQSHENYSRAWWNDYRMWELMDINRNLDSINRKLPDWNRR